MTTPPKQPILVGNADSILAAIIAFFVIYLFTRHGGIGISPDSIVYLSVARNMNEGKWLTEFSNMPVVLFPIFYPTFLGSIMTVTGKDIFAIAPYLNGVMFGLIILFTGVMMERFINRSRPYKIFVLLCLALSPALIEIYSMLWSETLFVLWSVFFFLAAKKYFNTHTLKTLTLLALIAAFACITRYAGVTFIATGGLLLLFDKQLQLKKKIGHIIFFGLIGSSLLVINLVRNAKITGMLTGMRQKSLTSFTVNMQYAGNVFCDWLSFFKGHYAIATILAFIVIILFVIVFLYRAGTFMHYYTYENITLTFGLVYLLFIIVSSTLSRYEQINNRLLAPAYIPFILSCTRFIPGAIAKITNKVKQGVFIILTSFTAIAFLIVQLGEVKANYKNVSEGGIGGYTEDTWTHSPTIDFLKKDNRYLAIHNFTYSNASHAIYFFTQKNTESLPERAHADEVKKFFEEKSFYLIWFNYEDNVDVLNLEEIAAKKKLTKLESFSDGAIYLVHSSNDSTIVK